jgi:hypothetical protein
MDLEQPLAVGLGLEHLLAHRNLTDRESSYFMGMYAVIDSPDRAPSAEP